MPRKKSKKPFKSITTLALGIPTNIAVGPLGFRAALEVDPIDGNDQEPRIEFREKEGGAQESHAGTSTAVPIDDIEQGHRPTRGTAGNVRQEDEPAVRSKVVLEQDCRVTTAGAPTIFADVEESVGGFGPLKYLLKAISAVYANHEEYFAAKDKVRWLLSCVASLDELFTTPPNYEDEKRRRDRVINEFEGIEGQLRSLSEEPGFQCLIDQAQVNEDVSRILEDLREAIFCYQMERQAKIYDQALNSIDPAEPAILKDLCPAREAEYRHGNRQSCLKGTRITVLDEIERWTRDFNKPPVYWLNGLAGMGKSTIAQTIAERIFSEGQLGASFFCSRDFEDRRNLKFIFPTIASQLARRYPEFRSILVPLVRSDSEIVNQSLAGQMNNLVVKPLMESAISTVIVIDALDECLDDQPASAILTVLGQSIEKIPKVKFFVTGRPEPRIRNGIRLSLSDEEAEVFVLHEVESAQVDRDMQLFYKHNFSQIRSRHRGLDDWPTKEQMDLLCKRAAGLFIYAMATVRFVDQKNKNPRGRLEQLIRSQESRLEGKTILGENKTLNSLYMSIFQEAFGDDPEDHAKVRFILGAVILAFEPPSPSMIAGLLGLDPGDVFPLLSSLHSLLILSEEIDEPVLPFHKSFPDFIVDPARCTDPRFCVSPPDQHAELLVGCLKLMNRKLGWGLLDELINIEAKNFSLWMEQYIDKSLKYACLSWYKHFDNTESTRMLKIMPILRRFLEEKDLFSNVVYFGSLEVIDILKDIEANNGIAQKASPQVVASSGLGALDQSRSSTSSTRIHVVGPEQDKPHLVQEISPHPSRISFSYPGTTTNKAEVNRLDGVLEQGSVDILERARALNKLHRLCYHHRDVPESAKIVDYRNESTTLPVYDGWTAVVFKGTYRARTVAVKVSRSTVSNREVRDKEFCKEAVIWRHLRHPNILPLIGVAIGSERYSLVSDWMDNGTINAFTEMNPDVNRVDLLIDVLTGLMYMHEHLIVHGDLKGGNILINQGGHACLAGFALSTVVGVGAGLDPFVPKLLDGNQGQVTRYRCARWLSPEILEGSRRTKESDVFALGMVIYEVLCGTIPFYKKNSPFRVMEGVMKGGRPAKPENAASLGFTSGLWEIVGQCWLADTDARPTLEAVFSCLSDAASSWGDRQKVV